MHAKSSAHGPPRTSPRREQRVGCHVRCQTDVLTVPSSPPLHTGSQALQDPDKIFPRVNATCDLEEVFAEEKKKKRYRYVHRSSILSLCAR